MIAYRADGICASCDGLDGALPEQRYRSFRPTCLPCYQRVLAEGSDSAIAWPFQPTLVPFPAMTSQQ